MARKSFTRTGAQGERTYNPLPPMESQARTERGQTSDNQQRTTNHNTLLSRQVSLLISNDVFNIDAPANGAIRLNKRHPYISQEYNK